jgi:hypothetical protein
LSICKMYSQRLIELLNDPRTQIIDRGDVITFDRAVCGDLACLKVRDEQCDLYVEGSRKAIFHFSRGMMVVALRRALLESL